MGKHLAPKKEHELNFIKIKMPHPSRQAVSKHEAPTAPKEERMSSTARKLPSLGRHPWAFYILAALWVVALRFLPIEGWMIPVAYAIPALLAIVEPTAGAYEKIRSGDYLSRELMLCAAAVLLFITGLYTEAVLLLLLSFLVSFLETRFFSDSTSKNDISEILPQYAVLVTEEGTERIDPSAVLPGDILLVRAGERIPLDGVIIDGITTVDTAAISGQRSPWAVNVGYRVYSGCKNLTSDIKIKVSRPYEQSTVKRIVQLATSAGEFPSEQEHLSARFQRIFIPAAAALAFFIGVVLPLFRGAWSAHLQRAAVLLTAAGMMTESFAISRIYGRAISLAEKFGIFAKGKDCLETIAQAETFIFDKTGSITEGRYAVTDVHPVKMSERQLLTIAAAGESFSRHPIAAAIREAAGKLDDRVAKATKLREIPGRGISALVGGRQLLIGNAALMEEHGIRFSIPNGSGIAVHVCVDTRYCGYIMLTDKVRRRAFDALETLRVNGVKKLVLLTGDVISVARPIASRLNFDMLRAELNPEEKAKAVSYLMKNKGARSTIAFVGDGENSGKIMTNADVGIAMGSLGSDRALACADIMIMDRDIFKIPKTLTISRLARRAALENFAVGAGVDLLLALLGVLGVISPLVAEILCAVLCVALLANTQRIR